MSGITTFSKKQKKEYAMNQQKEHEDKLAEKLKRERLEGG